MTQDEVMKQKDELICELHQEVEEAECKAEHKVEENKRKTAELLEKLNNYNQREVQLTEQ